MRKISTYVASIDGQLIRSRLSVRTNLTALRGRSHVKIFNKLHDKQARFQLVYHKRCMAFFKLIGQSINRY